MNSITLSFLILSAVYLAIGVYFFVFHWQETAVWFRILLPVLFLVNVVTVYLTAQPKTVKGKDRSDAVALERSFQKVQMDFLCDFLRRNRAGKRCILISGSSPDIMLLSALKAGLKDALPVVGEATLPMPAATEATEPPVGIPLPVSSAAALEQAISGAAAFDIAVICTPLPDDCLAENGMPLLQTLKGKELVLASGYRPSFNTAIENGTILAAVTYKPDAKCNETECPVDFKKPFDARISETWKAFNARYTLLSAIPEPEPQNNDAADAAAATR